MLTKEDLQAIVAAIHPLIKAEGDAIRKDMATKADVQDVKQYIDLNNKVFGTLFKVELATQKQEIIEALKILVQEEAKAEQEIHQGQKCKC